MSGWFVIVCPDGTSHVVTKADIVHAPPLRFATVDGATAAARTCEEDRKLATFARAILRDWWNDGDPGDLDGGGVQDAAEAAGLWRAVQEGEHSEDCEACGGAGGPCGELTEAGIVAVREGGKR